MDLVTPEWGLLFWTTLCFLILLFLLRIFAWKPILGAINNREYSIQKALSEAENARKELQNVTADSEKLLKQARADREAMLKEAREIKDKIVSDAKEQAQKEGAKIIRQAQETIEGEKKAAVADLRNQVAQLSITIAEKVIKEKFSDNEKQLKLVDSLLGDIKLN